MTRRTDRGRRTRVLAICAVEEKFDGTGGAVATWVKEVYSRLPWSSAVACPQASREYAGAVRTNPSRSAAAAARGITWVRRAAVLAGRNPSPAAIVLSGHGRLWVRALRSDIRASEIVHLQNRPDYAPYVRAQGFGGVIVCHMHNDLAVRRPDSATIGMVDAWLFCSDFIRNKALREFALDPARCFTVHNGSVVTSAGVSSRLKKRRNILFVGRLEQQKGPHEALEIWAAAVRGGNPCDLTLVGPTGIGADSKDTAYAAELRRRAQALSRELAPSRARFAGALPHHEVLRQMREARALLLPCTGIEAFGMVLVEAMGQGTPVIASAIGGIPEIIDASCGRLLTPQALVAEGALGLSEILAMPDTEYLALCEGAIARARRFSWEDAAAQAASAIDAAAT